jgi:hypothetical protein
MLAVQILNDAPQLNSWFKIQSVAYIPGETVKINFQLLDVDSAIRFIPPTTAIVTVGFKKNDGTTLTNTATGLFTADDRSIWQVVLSAADSAVVVGQNMIITVDLLGDASDIQQAIGNNVLSKTLFDGDC